MTAAVFGPSLVWAEHMAKLGGPQPPGAAPAGGGGGSLLSVEQQQHVKLLTKKLAEKGHRHVDPLMFPPPFPIQHFPVFTPPDRGRCELTQTKIERELVSCFVVGGEKRLCLPQLLNSVLRDFSLQDINSACDDLNIFCSRCNRDQLEILKVTGILPLSAPSCGLITNTDAERLCNRLLHSRPPQSASSMKIANQGFKVYHECFGKCKAVFIPELYGDAQADCIQCCECDALLSTDRFVCHSHNNKTQENRTVHWGFDSQSWRHYILLAKEANVDKYQTALEEAKAKFDFAQDAAAAATTAVTNLHLKRKQERLGIAPGRHGSSNNVVAMEAASLSKKLRCEDGDVAAAAADAAAYLASYYYPSSRLSAFRPWSPASVAAQKEANQKAAAAAAAAAEKKINASLKERPPPLQNPGRVVLANSKPPGGRHCQPNVTLKVPSPDSKEPSPAENGGSNTRQSQPHHHHRHRRNNSASHRGTEFELSTTDDDTSDASTPRQTGTPKESSMSPPEKPSEDLEFAEMRSVVESAVSEKESRDRILHQVQKLRMKLCDRLEHAIHARNALHQELTFIHSTAQEKLEAAKEAHNLLLRETESMRQDHEQRLREANESRHRMKRELEYYRGRKYEQEVRSRCESELRCKLKAEMDALKARLFDTERELANVQASSVTTPMNLKQEVTT